MKVLTLDSNNKPRVFSSIRATARTLSGLSGNTQSKRSVVTRAVKNGGGQVGNYYVTTGNNFNVSA